LALKFQNAKSAKDRTKNTERSLEDKFAAASPRSRGASQSTSLDFDGMKAKPLQQRI
jgi:hypothetical protein